MTSVDLTPDDLLRAYACGLFPMAERRDDPRLYLFDPDVRGIIPLDCFHVPRRLARRVRQGRFDLRLDTTLAAVRDSCAESRPPRPDSRLHRHPPGLSGAVVRRVRRGPLFAWLGVRV